MSGFVLTFHLCSLLWVCELFFFSFVDLQVHFFFCENYSIAAVFLAFVYMCFSLFRAGAVSHLDYRNRCDLKATKGWFHMPFSACVKGAPLKSCWMIFVERVERSEILAGNILIFFPPFLSFPPSTSQCCFCFCEFISKNSTLLGYIYQNLEEGKKKKTLK